MKDNITIGMDLGDRRHVAVVLDSKGDEIETVTVTNTIKGLDRFFKGYRDATVAIEAGTHSPWISRQLEQIGCTVYVGNPRKLRLIWDSHEKSDLNDARILAMVCRVEPRLLWPVKHRSEQSYADLETIKARDALVRSRTRLINHVRSSVKTTGHRISGCSAASFAHKASATMPASLKETLKPIIETIGQLTAQVKVLDRQIDWLCKHRYPESQYLRQVPGVGPITALAYILMIEDPHRFDSSRQVGAYLGLVPRRDQSGASDKQLRISKAGNPYLRRLLISCARYILGPFGPDSDLRRHGIAIAARGGKNANKRAAVAVARKLSVILHRLWMDRESYQSFRRPTAVKQAA